MAFVLYNPSLGDYLSYHKFKLQDLSVARIMRRLSRKRRLSMRTPFDFVAMFIIKIGPRSVVKASLRLTSYMETVSFSSELATVPLNLH
jgi:hypothetical protein